MRIKGALDSSLVTRLVPCFFQIPYSAEDLLLKNVKFMHKDASLSDVLTV